MRILLAAALALVVAAPAVADEAGVMKAAIDGYIVPGYAALRDEAAALAGEMDALCAAPSADSLAEARDGFADLVRAWARVDMVRFGPVVVENRLERVLFWPDRKSIALKQVQSALATGDETVLSVETLTGKSVALQGLTALEFVLFGTGSDDMLAASDGFRCGFGGAVARNIAGIGEALHAEWTDVDGIATHLIAPQADYADYRTPDEVMSEFLGLFSHGLERMRVQELTPILGDDPQSAKPKSALFWRSGLSVKMLAWETEGLADLFVTSGLADLLGTDGRWVEGSLGFEFANFANTADGLNRPIAEELAEQQSWDRVSYLSILTGSLEQIFGFQIATSLGIDLGFSALDGD